MRRNGRDDPHRLAVLAQRHDDLARMQMQARAAKTRRSAVDGVAKNGPAHRGAMYAQLVRPPGLRFERKPGHHPPLVGAWRAGVG